MRARRAPAWWLWQLFEFKPSRPRVDRAEHELDRSGQASISLGPSSLARKRQRGKLGQPQSCPWNAHPFKTYKGRLLASITWSKSGVTMLATAGELVFGSGSSNVKLGRVSDGVETLTAP